MRRTTYILALAAMAAIGGCGSSSSGDNKSNNTACTVKLTGAITATSACTVSATYARNILGVSDLSLVKTGDPGFNLGISKTGQLTKGVTTESSAGVRMAVTTASKGSITNGGLLWSQATEDPAHGSVTVNLTSVSVGSDGYTFTLHGTADATLTASQATPGATGTVTVHVDF
ncbi:MAG TPA: hypothetical protein VID74_07630 [Gemmatimonadales bacterium]